MSKPFSGLTFCCTGLESGQRESLAQMIGSLGGVFYTDLMSSVHYIVVGGRRTEKYKYSVRHRHDIQFIAPAAVQEIYGRWKNGDSVVAADTKKLHLGVFSNFTVCVARVDVPEAEERARYMAAEFRNPPAHARPAVVPENPFRADDLVNAMVKLGANVSSTLTPACTVLVSSDTRGKRYTMAREWGIPVVHPVWVLDSCLRGAALDPADYDLSDVPNYYVSGTFAWDKLYALRESRADIVPLRDQRSLKKSSDVWSSIMGTRTEPSKQVHDSRWEPEPIPEEAPKPTSRDIQRPPGIFAGLVFLPLDFSATQQNKLREVVESHSGRMASSAEDSGISHIVSLVKNGSHTHKKFQKLPHALLRKINNHKVLLVTDWFIERSLYYNKVCSDNWCKPLHGIVPSLSRLQVCVTGFTGVELLHLEKLITMLNFEFCSVLNARRDLLVVNINLFKASLPNSNPQLFEYKYKDVLECPVVSRGDESKSIATVSAKNKINAAKKWKIPIVSIAYLWEMLETSRGMPNLNIPDDSDSRWCFFAPEKSGAGQPDLAVTDGTNGQRVQLPSPKKSKEKHKYGRLVGGGESLSERLNSTRADSENPNFSDAELLDSDNDSTQVGYGNAESIKSNQDLMNKLEDLDRPSKRTRRR